MVVMRILFVVPLLTTVLWALVVATNIERLKNFSDLHDAAKELESARMQVTDNRKAYLEKRARLVYAFVRENKAAKCEHHHGLLLKTIEDYRAKAYNFVADSKKPSNWFSGFMKMIGPLGAMKNLAKFDRYLASITQRYESQASSGILSEVDVDCDLAKLHIRVLDAMMFVLRTDVKYLIMEDPQVNNVAIYRDLSENKFIAGSNFYDIDTLTELQRQLLFQFYTSRVDTNKVSIATGLDHFHNPGNLIIGRLLETCHKILDFESIWIELEPSRAQICAKSKSDLTNEAFSSRFELHGRSGIIDFCRQLLDAL